MCRKLIYLIFLTCVLGMAQAQAQDSEWDRAAYWDEQYPSAWAGGDVAIRDALQAAGYTILDADELKTWMDAHIVDKALSVVVFCRDAAPETVAESMSDTCTLRKYLDAGGKIVWYSDIPFYYQGHPDASTTTWGDAGGSAILGFNAASAPRDTYDEVVITDDGITWGLTETWESQRPTGSNFDNFTVLAVDAAGNATAWVKHFVPGDSYRGFVRIYDRTGIPTNVDDIIRIAEYINLHSAGPNPADGTIIRDTWVSLTWAPGAFAVSHDIYLSDNFNDVDAGTPEAFRGNQAVSYLTIGFPGFPYPDGLVPGTTYYWRIDGVEADGTIREGDVWSFMIAPKTAYNPDPADGAESVDPNVVLSWVPGMGGILHTVYFGDDYDVVSNAAGGLPTGHVKYTPGTLELEKVYYWRVDAFDGFATRKGDIWSFSTPGAVGSPKPANGAVDVKHTPVLKWSPSDSSASHQVYFGTDKDTVQSANTGSSEYKGTKALGEESYDPGKLEWNTTYCWRVDEVKSDGTTQKGNVWSFTTANFLVLDDFEDYDAGENQIWYIWKDGLGYGVPGTDPYYQGNGSGSAVGDENTPSYTEETIVHGGSQAMPLFYDNNKPGFFMYSETEMTLTYPRDWTEKGVNRLTIWFRGSSGNAAETLYVALNGSAVVSHDNPDAAQVATWTEWNIDLQAFADQGVSLTNVNTIALGLGNKKNPLAGGSGTMYFDDIRLYPPPPEPEPAP